MVRLLCMLALGLLVIGASASAQEYGRVAPGVELRFPRDRGSHPEFRTEWWYVTAWVKDPRGQEFGIQITFFRSRPGVAEDNPSRFAPRQLLFAHAAVADGRAGRLLHDQRAARAGFGLAEAAQSHTAVHIDDWSLSETEAGYLATLVARDFSLDLSFARTQDPLLQGERGTSRKGPRPTQASHYYSEPQLALSGTLTMQGEKRQVTGRAWLDHEWSSEYLAAQAVGWDWIGINLDDGGALMAFRIRDRKGADFWAGGSLRTRSGRVRILRPEDIEFAPLRRWRSPRTGIEYPVSMRVRAGELEIALEPWFDEQELDARASTGTIYWEGAVRALVSGRRIGAGYLELTGYGEALRF